ncbi:hypothetical protein ACJEDT_16310 [Rhodococcoides fascians]|uniref:hypothetical protein n=1 Tax=Rhodococcoides fascians TaxID=1828 RepID=UPI00389B1813
MSTSTWEQDARAVYDDARSLLIRRQGIGSFSFGANASIYASAPTVFKLWDDLITFGYSADASPSESASIARALGRGSSVDELILTINAEAQRTTPPSESPAFTDEQVGRLASVLMETFRTLAATFSGAEIAQPVTSRSTRNNVLVEGFSSALALYEAVALLHAQRGQLEGLASAATESARRAAASAGIVAESKLSAQYRNFARKESQLSWIFMALTLGGIIAGIVAIAKNPLSQNASLPQSLHQAAVVAVILGLAGYFARQAGEHRTAKTWAEVLTVQLQTFSDFVEPLQDAAMRDDMRVQFGVRVFTSSPSGPDRGSVDELTIAQQVTGLLASKKE